MKKNLKTFLWFAGITVCIALLAIPKIQGDSDNNSSKSPSVSSSLSVNGFIINKTLLENKISVVGSVMANEEVELKSEVGGRITGVYFSEGSKVNKGKLLVSIDNSELLAELKRTEVRKKLAEETERRQKVLLSKGGVSQSEYDLALHELNVLEAEIDLLKARIAKTKIVAPFSGNIGLKHVSPGGYIPAGTNIAAIQDLSKLKIEFSIPQRYAPLLKSGTRIKCSVQGVSDAFDAHIYAIDPKIDPQTRTVQVRALSVSHSNSVFPGAFAQVEILLDEIEDGLLVPSKAVVPDIRGHKIYVYRSGLVEVIPVEIGMRKENSVQIVKGLAAGDTVITSGILQLRPGSSVLISHVE